MNTPKSSKIPQQSDETASSMIPSTQAEQGVSITQQNEALSHLISSSQAGQQVGQQESASSWFQGVFSLENGHWGAKINDIPLGTFKSEIAAARAYDSAALKLFDNDFMRNLLLTGVTINEPLFHGIHNSEVIINMIKDGSYERNYKNFLYYRCHDIPYGDSVVMPTSLDAIKGLIFKELFRKEILLTECQNQNFLILPTKAQLCFEPLKSYRGEVWCEFKDRTNRSWAFQLCLLNNSQVYVFSAGWNKFFREMELRGSDIVLFYHYMDLRNFPDRFSYMIDVIRGVRYPWLLRQY
ncbi:AP2/ERF and B3 domain-containing transcription factor At1g50680-like [Phalaenopsis equestris]|uniref:AP2/ERF and B3 domain-containing transcription factor At1g50680-like n=1 Tax=Phalaenopsis equestris TaxID=78828 RepID=UPI0009E3F53B|nr:AP2/ERF and B3 domain-containing transcription factor At1g50680-like [Phalaenopsis equestris]